MSCYRSGSILLVSVSLFGVGCGSDGAGQDWRAALASAAAGQTVVVPPGVHAGPVSVAAGVTLQASDEGEVTLKLESEGPLLIADTGSAAAGPTRVAGLKLHSAGDVALLVRGQGEFVGEALELRCSRGVGIAAEGLRRLELREVQVVGTITAEQVPQLVFPAKGSDAPVIGLAVADVQQVELRQVSVSQFGGFGAVLVDSDADWQGGEVAGNVGVGVIQDGGRLALDGVKIKQTMVGQRGTAILAYGLVLVGEGTATTVDLEVADNQGHGIVQASAAAAHVGLRVRDNNDVGIWLQDTVGQAGRRALQISGQTSEIVANRGGGLFVIDSGEVEVADARIADTSEKKIPRGDLALTTMADGVQVSGLRGALALRDLQLSDNRRVGLLLSGALSSAVTISGLRIDGGGRHGMIVEQGAEPASSWQVERDPLLAAADEAVAAPLGAAAPLQGLPAVTAIREHGIVADRGLLGPDGSDSARYSIGLQGLTPEND